MLFNLILHFICICTLVYFHLIFENKLALSHSLSSYFLRGDQLGLCCSATQNLPPFRSVKNLLVFDFPRGGQLGQSCTVTQTLSPLSNLTQT